MVSRIMRSSACVVAHPTTERIGDHWQGPVWFLETFRSLAYRTSFSGWHSRSPEG